MRQALRFLSLNNMAESHRYRKQLGATDCFKKQKYLHERDDGSLFQFYAQ